MSTVRKRRSQPPADSSSDPVVVVTHADADDPAWDEAIERWLLGLLDNKITPDEGGQR